MGTKTPKRGTSSAPKVPKIEQTAFHEAGHAVLAFELRRRIVSVTVRPGTDSAGHMVNSGFSEQFQPDIRADRVARATIEREVMIFYAGCAAQSARVGRNVTAGSSGDLLKAARLLSYLCRSPEEESAYGKWLWVRAKDSVTMPTTWTCIARLADELMRRGTMSGREVRELLVRVRRDLFERKLRHVLPPTAPGRKARAMG